MNHAHVLNPVLHSLALLGVAVLAAAPFAAAPGQAHAACSVLSDQPCTPYTGSVLRQQPFTPYSCGVSGGPCSPEVPLRTGRTPTLKVEGHDGPAEPVDREHRLDRVRDIGPVLSKCLQLPSGADAQPGMEIVLRFALRRSGELMGEPNVTYTARDASEQVKAAYHAAALDMFQRCTPLPLTEGFGSAIAGRPIVITLRDSRDLRPSRPAPAVPGEQKL